MGDCDFVYYSDGTRSKKRDETRLMLMFTIDTLNLRMEIAALRLEELKAVANQNITLALILTTLFFSFVQHGGWTHFAEFECDAASIALSEDLSRPQDANEINICYFTKSLLIFCSMSEKF